MAALALAIALLGAPKAADALTYSGRVVRVVDGDTLSLATDTRELVRIRLSDIDAPENGQAYGRAAKRELQKLVRGRRIVARVNDTDRYGRAVARIDRAGLDVNAEMVRRGAAWAYTRYQTDGRFARWERQARAAKLGLWSSGAGKPVPPWDWRAERRGVTSIRTTAQALRLTSREVRGPSSSFTCGKRLCRQMVSCAEAVFSLRQCGVGRLDGDGDGKPCESLCS
jgi:endonuclease YncB( thermonuclease family)